jgi:hypothetical protein
MLEKSIRGANEAEGGFELTGEIEAFLSIVLAYDTRFRKPYS